METATATATGTATVTAVPTATGTPPPTDTPRPTVTRTTPAMWAATGTAIGRIRYRHLAKETADGDATVPGAPARVSPVLAARRRPGRDRRGGRHPPLAVDHDGAE